MQKKIFEGIVYTLADQVKAKAAEAGLTMTDEMARSALAMQLQINGDALVTASVPRRAVISAPTS